MYFKKITNNITQILLASFYLDMAKRAGRVGFRSGQSGRGSKRVTGQNGSFLNGSIGLRVKRVAG